MILSEQQSNEELLNVFQEVLTMVKENNGYLRNLVRKIHYLMVNYMIEIYTVVGTLYLHDI